MFPLETDALTGAPRHPLWLTLKAANRLASKHFSRAHALGRCGYWSGAQWISVVLAFDLACAYCGARPNRLEVDHITPYAAGGDNRISNVVPACPTCNRLKGPRRAEAFTSRAHMSYINHLHPYRDDRTGEPDMKLHNRVADLEGGNADDNRARDVYKHYLHLMATGSGYPIAVLHETLRPIPDLMMRTRLLFEAYTGSMRAEYVDLDAYPNACVDYLACLEDAVHAYLAQQRTHYEPECRHDG